MPKVSRRCRCLGRGSGARRGEKRWARSIVGRDQDSEGGLAFDLLSSDHETVFTGHDDGLITLNLAEGDDVHRGQLRIAMDEPYRTLLGHFATRSGTTTFMYFHALADSTHLDLPRFRELFGDPDTDYQEALDRHDDEGAPEGWSKNYVSYARPGRRTAAVASFPALRVSRLRLIDPIFER